MSKFAKSNSQNLKTVLLFGFAVLVIYVFVPQLASFRNSLTTLKHADFALVGVSLLFLLVSYILASVIYQLISRRRLIFGRTILVQTASGFTNRLLPAGGGALAITVEYLIKSGYALPQASALAALNNILGFVGNFMLLAFVFGFGGTKLGLNNRPHVSYLRSVLVLMAIIGMILLIALARKLRAKLKNLLTKTFQELLKSFHQPQLIIVALAVSILLTSCLVATFYFTTLAVNVHLTLSQTFFVFTVGIVATTITPTPGGLGGAEASMTLAFTSIGISPQQALAATLSYRLITYWLPILPGLVAFQICRQKRLI